MTCIWNSSSRESSSSTDAEYRRTTTNILTEDVIKTAAQVFDTALVFKLNISSRGISSIRPTALFGCTNMTELDLSNNNLERIQGLDKCSSLRLLNLSGNRILSIDGLQGLDGLETLMLQGNRLKSVEALNLPLLGELPSLRGLYLQDIDGSRNNPVTKTRAYPEAVLSTLPKLRNLDGERNPRTTGYKSAAAAAIAAAEAAELEVTIDDLELPPPQPWLSGWSFWDGERGADAILEAVSSRLKGVELKIEHCRLLMSSVRKEQTKCRSKSGTASWAVTSHSG
mmetsp:Transcript_27397/g.64892  ORF Transcript_27397/g.64892 Transcript_27397/m.64892 type:complete len:283 (-) Transcript_27397:145-993(-)